MAVSNINAKLSLKDALRSGNMFKVSIFDDKINITDPEKASKFSAVVSSAGNTGSVIDFLGKFDGGEGSITLTSSVST